MNGRSSRRKLRIQRNVVLLGGSMVGKTAICLRYMKNQFDNHWTPTLENNFSKQFQYKEQIIEMIIKDTQGINDPENFRNEYGYGYHGYILVYSIDDRRSLETLKLINSKVLSLTHHQKVPRVLVGNKLDQNNSRQVSIEEGQALADYWGCAFVECSAKENSHLEEIFHSMIDEIEKASEPENGKFSDSPCAQCLDLLCCRVDESLLDPTRLELALKCLTYSTLVLGLVIVLLSIGIGVSISENGHESSLLSYVLFGFGFLVCIISILGLIGVKQANEDFLRVYWVSLTIVLITEIIVWSILYHHLQLLAQYIYVSAILFFISVTLKTLSIGVVCCYQKTQTTIDSPYPHTYGTMHEW